MRKRDSLTDINGPVTVMTSTNKFDHISGLSFFQDIFIFLAFFDFRDFGHYHVCVDLKLNETIDLNCTK